MTFYEIDFIINNNKILELNGNNHFLIFPNQPEKRTFLPTYKFKLNHLKILGFPNVKTLNHFDFEIFDTN